jgi:hypothetical protein
VRAGRRRGLVRQERQALDTASGQYGRRYPGGTAAGSVVVDDRVVVSRARPDSRVAIARHSPRKTTPPRPCATRCRTTTTWLDRAGENEVWADRPPGSRSFGRCPRPRPPAQCYKLPGARGQSRFRPKHPLFAPKTDLVAVGLTRNPPVDAVKDPQRPDSQRPAGGWVAGPGQTDPHLKASTERRDAAQFGRNGGTCLGRPCSARRITPQFRQVELPPGHRGVGRSVSGATSPSSRLRSCSGR